MPEWNGKAIFYSLQGRVPDFRVECCFVLYVQGGVANVLMKA